MDYLGLGADDAYDDYDMSLEMERPARPARGYHPSDPSGRVQRPRVEYDYEDDRGAIPADSGAHPRPDDSDLRLRPVGAPRQTATVRPLTAAGGEPVTVRPQRFEQAKEIADRFKEGQPVIMNLETTEPEVMRRLIDFASGICYALNGSMERVASGVFLLKPSAQRHSHRD
jgi:cell division inhibitor SepF